MGKGLYVGTIVVLSLIIIIILIIVLKSKKKKRMLTAVNNLEKEKNMLINVPVLSELSKVKALVKNNSKLEEKYNAWDIKFQMIENETIPLVNDMLIEVDFLIDKSNSKEVYQKISEIEIKLYEVKTKIKNILSEIKEIRLSEERNRATVIKLKTQYRNLKKKFEENAVKLKEYIKNYAKML